MPNDDELEQDPRLTAVAEVVERVRHLNENCPCGATHLAPAARDIPVTNNQAELLDLLLSLGFSVVSVLIDGLPALCVVLSEEFDDPVTGRGMVSIEPLFVSVTENIMSMLTPPRADAVVVYVDKDGNETLSTDGRDRA